MTNVSERKLDSILIMLMGALGDVARALTIVAPLKKHFPQAQITWVIEPKCFDLVKQHRLIDRVIVFRRKAGLLGVLELAKELRKNDFDLCLDLQRHFKSAIFSRLSGAKRIIGFNPQDSKELNWLFAHEHIEACAADLPKIEHYWKFLTHLGVPAPVNAEVDLQLESRDSIFEKFSLSGSSKYIILVLGSSWSSKNWPGAGYQKLILQLSAQQPQLKFILTGGKEHDSMAEGLKKACGSEKITNLCGRSTLSELCVLIKASAVVVGPDSGPGHLAALFGVPYVGLFGPTDARRTAPYGDKVSIVSARIGCSPCYRRICPGLDKLCMRMINPLAVSQAVQAEL